MDPVNSASSTPHSFIEPIFPPAKTNNQKMDSLWQGRLVTLQQEPKSMQQPEISHLVHKILGEDPHELQIQPVARSHSHGRLPSYPTLTSFDHQMQLNHFIDPRNNPPHILPQIMNIETSSSTQKKEKKPDRVLNQEMNGVIFPEHSEKFSNAVLKNSRSYDDVPHSNSKKSQNQEIRLTNGIAIPLLNIGSSPDSTSAKKERRKTPHSKESIAGREKKERYLKPAVSDEPMHIVPFSSEESPKENRFDKLLAPVSPSKTRKKQLTAQDILFSEVVNRAKLLKKGRVVEGEISQHICSILDDIQSIIFGELSKERKSKRKEEFQEISLVADPKTQKIFSSLGNEWASRLVLLAFEKELSTLQDMHMPLRNDTVAIRLLKQFTFFCMPKLDLNEKPFLKFFIRQLEPLHKEAKNNPDADILILREWGFNVGSRELEKAEEAMNLRCKPLQEKACNVSKELFATLTRYIQKTATEEYRSFCKSLITLFDKAYLKHGYEDKVLDPNEAHEKSLFLLSSLLFFRIISHHLTHLPKVNQDTIGDLGLFFAKILSSIGNQSQRQDNQYMHFIPNLALELKPQLLQFITNLTTP